MTLYKKFYAVRNDDCKEDTQVPPGEYYDYFTVITPSELLQRLSEAFNDQNKYLIGIYPESYSLICIGYFDPKRGIVFTEFQGTKILDILKGLMSWGTEDGYDFFNSHKDGGVNESPCGEGVST